MIPRLGGGGGGVLFQFSLVLFFYIIMNLQFYCTVRRSVCGLQLPDTDTCMTCSRHFINCVQL